MADTIMQIIQWAIPSGGIGAAIAWIANHKVKQASAAKSVHDTYKLMYEDISRELLATQKKVDESTKTMEGLGEENKRIRYALNRLTRAIQAIQRCPHSGSCPVSNELSLDEDGDDGKPGRNQRNGKGQHRGREKRDSSVVDGIGEGGHSPAGDSA